MGPFQRSQDGDCRCGRPRRAARVVSYRSFRGSYQYHRCDCGTEWTERVVHVDRSVPVSSDEVLDVHLLLAEFQGRLNDLVERPPA